MRGRSYAYDRRGGMLGWARRRGERGQSLVEFAIAVPIFLALMYGCIEMGMVFKTRSAYQQAVQEAARVGAQAGSTDQMALSELQSMLPAENLNTIQSVTIYDATISNTLPPVSATGMYTTYQYNPTTQGFDQVGSASWTIASRNTKATALDRLGVQVVYRYNSLTGAFGPITMSQNAVALLEPSQYGP